MKSIEQRKQRWLDFYDWDKSVKHVYTIGFPLPIGMPRWLPWPENKENRIEYAVRKYRLLCEQAEWLDDDTVPFLDLYTGTEIFAEAFGCRVHKPEDNMPFALPLIHSSEEAAKLKVPEVSSSTLSVLFEMAEKMRARAGKDALLRLPDIQSPLDIAALIWEKSSFFIAMIEEPEAVLELIEKTKTLLKNFLDAWFAEFGTEYIAHFPDYYMSGGLTLSEDEVGAINADMFDEFSQPSLTELSEYFGGIGVHCCANAEHQWENFRKIPDLRLLNLIQPQSVLQRAYPYFAGHTCQLHGGVQAVGEPWTWPGQFPEDCRFVIQVSAKERERALELSEKLREVCG